jgi:hypothetical protein
VRLDAVCVCYKLVIFKCSLHVHACCRAVGPCFVQQEHLEMVKGLVRVTHRFSGQRTDCLV